MAADLHWTTGQQLAGRFRRGECSPSEVTEAALARIAEFEPLLHAFSHVDAEGARVAAHRAEDELRAGVDRGPLHGVPMAVKDLCAVRGLPHTAGSPVRADLVPDDDSTVVARLREAGAVLLGTLQMTEGAYTHHHPSVTPPCNPWDVARWTGISSSGPGVATAAGLCAASLGSDTGGSIRFPSAANGVVGLKPTHGRVPLHGVAELAYSLDHVGPMARSVADAALVLDVITGFDARDPHARQAPPPRAAAALGDGVRGLRIGIDEAFAHQDQDPAIVAPILACADVLRDAGAEIVPVRVPSFPHVAECWLPICAAECAEAHADLYPARRDDYGPQLAQLLDFGRGVSPADLEQARLLRRKVREEFAPVLEVADLLLCPTLGVPVPEAVLDWLDVDAIGALVRFTGPFDLTGSPTISVPCGLAADGLPLSLQLVGRHFDEAVLCRGAHAFECATPWKDRHPPV
jgi:amidase